MVAIFNRKFLGLGLRCHDTDPSGTGILPGCRNDDRVFGFLLLGLVGLEHQLVLVGAAVVLVGCRRVDLTVTVPGHLHRDSNLAGTSEKKFRVDADVEFTRSSDLVLLFFLLKVFFWCSRRASGRE